MKPFSKLGLSEIFVWNVKPYLNLLFSSKCHLEIFWKMGPLISTICQIFYYEFWSMSKVLQRTVLLFLFQKVTILNTEYESCHISYTCHTYLTRKTPTNYFTDILESATFTCRIITDSVCSKTTRLNFFFPTKKGKDVSWEFRYFKEIKYWNLFTVFSPPFCRLLAVNNQSTTQALFERFCAKLSSQSVSGYSSEDANHSVKPQSSTPEFYIICVAPPQARELKYWNLFKIWQN